MPSRRAAIPRPARARPPSRARSRARCGCGRRSTPAPTRSLRRAGSPPGTSGAPRRRTPGWVRAARSGSATAGAAQTHPNRSCRAPCTGSRPGSGVVAQAVGQGGLARVRSWGAVPASASGTGRAPSCSRTRATPYACRSANTSSNTWHGNRLAGVPASSDTLCAASSCWGSARALRLGDPCSNRPGRCGASSASGAPSVLAGHAAHPPPPWAHDSSALCSCTRRPPRASSEELGVDGRCAPAENVHTVTPDLGGLRWTQFSPTSRHLFSTSRLKRPQERFRYSGSGTAWSSKALAPTAAGTARLAHARVGDGATQVVGRPEYEMESAGCEYIRRRGSPVLGFRRPAPERMNGVNAKNTTKFLFLARPPSFTIPDETGVGSPP